MKRQSFACLAALTISFAAHDAAAQSAPPIVAPTGGAVRIHLRTLREKSSARAYLHQTDGSFKFACSTPCTLDVPINGEMQITYANNEDDPHTFVVPGDLGAEIDLEVRPPSVGSLIGSVVLLGSGGAFILSGLLLVAVSDVGTTTSRSVGGSTTTNDNTQGVKNIGWVMTGIGAAAALSGFIWLLTRSHEPRVQGTPFRAAPDVYGRTETVLGDVAVAKPREPAILLPAFTPLQYGFTF